MAPCAPGHSSAHAVPGSAPILSKAVKRTCKGRLGLGAGLGVGSRRYIRLSFRTRDQENAVFEAVPAEPPSRLMTIIDLSQAFSIFMVMGIQIGLIVRKRSADISTPTMTHSKHIARTDDPLMAAAEHQPLFLAWALACALFARVFAPRKLEIQAKGVATQALRQNSDTVQVKESLRHVERQMSKMQSRVLICAEQFRTLRRSNDESRVVTNEVLMQHGTALAEVQEQANSLQRVLSSLQDVVVKQIEVITPPIKRLNAQVRALEEEIRELKGRAEPEGGRAADHPACGSGTTGATKPHPGEGNLARSRGEGLSGDNNPETCTQHTDCTTQRSGFQYADSGKGITDTASTAASTQDTAGASAAEKLCSASSGMQEAASPSALLAAASPPPEYPNGHGRMMQMSWRGATSDAAPKDGTLAPARQTTCSVANESRSQDADVLHASGSTGGQVMHTTFQMGAGVASSQEPQWSQKEQSAMTLRLHDLCCNYAAASVMGYQPLCQGVFASAAARAGSDDTMSEGERAVLPRRMVQNRHHACRPLQPAAFGHTMFTYGLRRPDSQGHTEAVRTSAVPNSGQKLQAIDIAGTQVRSSDDTAAEHAHASPDSGPIPVWAGDTGITLLAQHGFLTLLTFAISSVVWAPPVV